MFLRSRAERQDGLKAPAESLDWKKSLLPGLLRQQYSAEGVRQNRACLCEIGRASGGSFVFRLQPAASKFAKNLLELGAFFLDKCRSLKVQASGSAKKSAGRASAE
jgi:hypothetical protein